MPSDERAARNDEWLEQLYRDLEKPMFNVVYRWLWDSSEAQDVIQETFIRLWEARYTLRDENLRPLAFRTALNLASNRLRSRRIRRWLSLEGIGEAVSLVRPAPEQLSDAEQQAALRRAIDSLPEPQRRVIVLTELSGMSYDQVGATLKIPAGTVASRRHLAMRRLRELLGDPTEELT